MKNLDMLRVAACFTTCLVVGTLLEQITPLSTGTSLGQTLIEKALLGAFVTGVLVFFGYLRRDAPRATWRQR